MSQKTQTQTAVRHRARRARRSAATLAAIVLAAPALAVPAGAAAKPIRPLVIDPGNGARVQRTSGSPDGAAVAGVLGATVLLAGGGAAFRRRNRRSSESGIENAGRVTGLTPRPH